MCQDCGCSTTHNHDNHSHAHDHKHHHDHDHKHPHTHDHDHDHSHHSHEHKHEETAKISLERNLLEKNNSRAELNRQFLAEKGVIAVNLISSPGSGKTTLLEKTLLALKDKIPCAVVTGDQQTDNDAQRLQGRGAEVRQIETYNSCHLDAELISAFLPELVTDGIKLLFIENIGNLVCPAAFDLGENFKIALLSSTEGEDKPVKYPTLFSGAPVTVLTKMDLEPHLDWDVKVCRENLRKVHPGMFIFELSAKTGAGMDEWINYLTGLVN